MPTQLLQQISPRGRIALGASVLVFFVALLAKLWPIAFRYWWVAERPA